MERFSQNRSFDARTDVMKNQEGPYLISRG